MSEEKTYLTKEEKLFVKKEILKYLLNFDDKEILEKVNATYDLETKLAKELINEVWQDVNGIYNVKYCDCRHPQRESGHAYCHKCRLNVEDDMIQISGDLQERLYQLVNSQRSWLVNSIESKYVLNMLDFIPFSPLKAAPMDESLMGSIYNMPIYGTKKEIMN
jgi:hypothetical protein